MKTPFPFEAPLFSIIDKFENHYIVNEYELRLLQINVAKGHANALPFVGATVIAHSNDVDLSNTTNRMCSIESNGQLSTSVRGIDIADNLAIALHLQINKHKPE